MDKLDIRLPRFVSAKKTSSSFALSVMSDASMMLDVTLLRACGYCQVKSCDRVLQTGLLSYEIRDANYLVQFSSE